MVVSGTAQPGSASCADCPVRAYCLAFALSRDVPHGVWAGLTAGEVWSLRDQLAAGRKPAEVVAASLALSATRGKEADEAVYYSPAPDRSSPGALPYQARRHRHASSHEGRRRATTRELMDLPEPTGGPQGQGPGQHEEGGAGG